MDDIKIGETIVELLSLGAVVSALSSGSGIVSCIIMYAGAKFVFGMFTV